MGASSWVFAIGSKSSRPGALLQVSCDLVGELAPMGRFYGMIHSVSGEEAVFPWSE